MSKTFTLRLDDPSLRELQYKASRHGLPPRTLAQRYIDEGMRVEDHPLVHFVNGPSGRRAALRGLGLDVWEVVATIRENDSSLEVAARYLDVPLAAVEAAANYYGTYQDEIEAEIRFNEAEWERGFSAQRAGRSLRSE